MKHSIVQLTKNKTAKFSHFQCGKLFYTIDVEDIRYQFPIDTTNEEEIGMANFNAEEKAGMLRRYVNIAIKEETISYFKIPNDSPTPIVGGKL